MSDINSALTTLFSELTEGANRPGGAFILNSGDAGLLRSLEALPTADASRSLAGGATVAAHAQHLRYGLSLMNRWAREGGNRFAEATWDEAWKILSSPIRSGPKSATVCAKRSAAGRRPSERRAMSPLLNCAD